MSNINSNINKNNNPSWPPIINRYVIIKLNYSDKTYFGQVHNKLDDTKYIIKILNDVNYIDNSYENGINRGYMVLIDSYSWNYVSENKINQLLEQSKNGNKSNDINYKDLLNENIYNDSSNPMACGVKIDDIHDPHIYTSDENRKNNLFTDDLVFDDVNIGNEFKIPSKENMDELKNHLHKFYSLRTTSEENPDGLHDEEPKDMKFIASKTLTVDNLMTNPKEIEREGLIIADKLIDKYVNNRGGKARWLLNDLIVKVHTDGYVHVTREGVKLKNIITEDLVPGLSNLVSEYGKPIDYQKLKHLVIHTDTERNLDKKTYVEAEKILAQENLIILQPKPQFQWWCIKRLMQIWYSSEYMLSNIRKIKILINQYRGDSTKDHNKKFGTLPSIVIYPVYGTQPARSIISTLTKYFTIYNDVGWECSQPSYTKKISNLLWYSNGNLDLKYYYRNVVKNENIESGTFESNFSKLRGGPDIIFENVGLSLTGGSNTKYVNLNLNLNNFIYENGYKITPYNLYFNLPKNIKKLI